MNYPTSTGGDLTEDLIDYLSYYSKKVEDIKTDNRGRHYISTYGFGGRKYLPGKYQKIV